ncbi:MAG: SMC family ATPase [Armatimonadetes bacterium]|nr:SMC family ATPase [Armatimonadota bacterium]
MIPVRLTLHNFLSYGDNVGPLDFSGMRLACLSGSNGHGKSALLDAITWALWGRARSNQDDDLVRQGQSEMRVELDFEFDGNLYRVVRKRSLGRRSVPDLQFQVFEGEGFRALTEPSVSQTEGKIRKLLRLDYDTFINSAFLMQGRADEFTGKSPRQRKDVLAEILGLRLYDDLVTLAREKARQADARRERADLALRSLEAEIAREGEYRDRIDALQTSLEALQQETETLQADCDALFREKADLDSLDARLQSIVHRLAQERSAERQLLQQIEAARQTVARHESLLAEKEAITASYDQLLKVRACLEECEAKWRTLQGQERDRMSLENALAQEKHRLEMALRQEEKALRELRERCGEPDRIRAGVAVLEKEIEALAGLDLDRVDRQIETEKLAAEIGALKQDLEQKKKENEKIVSNLRQLSEPGAECPLCRTPLSPEHKEEVHRQLQEEQAALKAEGLYIKEQMNRKEACRTSLQKEIEKLGQGLKGMPALQGQLGRMQQSLAQVEDSLAKLPGQEAACEKVRQEMTGEAYLPECRAELKALGDSIAALGYDEPLHSRMREEADRLRECEEKRLRLEQAEKDLGQAKASLMGLEALLAQRRAALEADEALQRQLSADLTRRPEVLKKLQDCQTGLTARRSEERHIVGDLRTFQTAYERCQEMKEEAAGKRAERDAGAKDKGIYDDLAAIFGKNGIQALIIENAIPEIEAKANEILARMTENGMRVAFETQRAARSDDRMIETLDIKISDSLGSRKYELFSGGEAFRANFAIRVALSHLLARRAGARLQTLFIDEGFGSQDSEGRARLIDAIESIREDFDLVLVITHFDDMKNQFDIRIEVTKDHLGSQVMVVTG